MVRQAQLSSAANIDVHCLWSSLNASSQHPSFFVAVAQDTSNKSFNVSKSKDAVKTKSCPTKDTVHHKQLKSQLKPSHGLRCQAALPLDQSLQFQCKRGNDGPSIGASLQSSRPIGSDQKPASGKTIITAVPSATKMAGNIDL